MLTGPFDRVLAEALRRSLEVPCLTVDPEMFFAPGVRTERKAKAICGRCPVQGECLVFALESRTEFGIWGGLNGKERRRLLHRFAGIIPSTEVLGYSQASLPGLANRRGTQRDGKV